jgi:hypothetical protein
VTKSPYTEDEDFTHADRVVAHLDEGITLAACRALVRA